MKNKILSTISDRIGITDSKAAGAVQWTRTSAKLRAGGLVTAAAAMASEFANPALSEFMGAILLMLPFDALAGFERPVGIVLSAVLGYAVPVVTGYYTREPDTSIRR